MTFLRPQYREKRKSIITSLAKKKRTVANCKHKMLEEDCISFLHLPWWLATVYYHNCIYTTEEIDNWSAFQIFDDNLCGGGKKTLWPGMPHPAGKYASSQLWNKFHSSNITTRPTKHEMPPSKSDVNKSCKLYWAMLRISIFDKVMCMSCIVLIWLMNCVTSYNKLKNSFFKFSLERCSS